MSDGRMPAGPLPDVFRPHLELADRPRPRRRRAAALGRRPRSGRRALPPGGARRRTPATSTAAAILDDAARELALLVSCTRDQLGFAADEPVAVSWSGGTFAAARVREGFRRELLARHPADDLRHPLLPPVLGAALYAARVSGHPLAEDALARLTLTARTLPDSEPETG